MVAYQQWREEWSEIYKRQAQEIVNKDILHSSITSIITNYLYIRRWKREIFVNQLIVD